ncbi:MAG: hypothetical protein IJ526_02910 [Lachnospiraceae bacterium]|nr:hypothetical protein [Lachnospiraceae bacterium]
MIDIKNFNGKKLSEDQLEQVDGGFVQTIPGYSYGCVIKCPTCGNAEWNKFTCDGDILAEIHKDLYRCGVCGQLFAAASGYGITDIISADEELM